MVATSATPCPFPRKPADTGKGRAALFTGVDAMREMDTQPLAFIAARGMPECSEFAAMRKKIAESQGPPAMTSRKRARARPSPIALPPTYFNPEKHAEPGRLGQDARPVSRVVPRAPSSSSGLSFLPLLPPAAPPAGGGCTRSTGKPSRTCCGGASSS